MVKLRTNNFTEGHDKKTKTQWIYSEIRKAILNNVYLPGTMLVERVLCDKYDVSRTPIREALKQLINEGLLCQIVGTGTFVSEESFEDMIEIFEMREALEREAIKLFIIKDNDILINKLEECYKTQMICENSDPVNFMERDMDFHFIIADGAKNRRLIYALEMIYDQIRMMAMSAENDGNLRSMARLHHQKIIDAVRKRDVELGEKCIVEHIIEVKKYHMSKYIASS